MRHSLSHEFHSHKYYSLRSILKEWGLKTHHSATSLRISILFAAYIPRSLKSIHPNDTDHI